MLIDDNNFNFLLPFQVPKEKRLLQLPKAAELTEEQEKRSVNAGECLTKLRKQKAHENILNALLSVDHSTFGGKS